MKPATVDEAHADRAPDEVVIYPPVTPLEARLQWIPVHKPRDLEPYVSRVELQRVLGFKAPAISNAYTAELFPSAWYGPIAKLCHDRGYYLPTNAFRWTALPDLRGERQDAVEAAE